MKTNGIKWTLSLAAVVALLVSIRAADNLVTFGYAPGTKVSVDGTSTIHDWTVEGSLIGGIFEVEPEFLADKTLKSVPCFQPGKVPKINIFIPVSSLHNKGGYQKMDEIMCEAMRAEENKKILYKLTEWKIKGEVPASGTPVKLDTKGELAVAGVTNVIEMEVTLERLDNNQIKWTGAAPLKMTNFKITPPAPKIAAGLIKTGDEVKVKFEWLLVPKNLKK